MNATTWRRNDEIYGPTARELCAAAFVLRLVLVGVGVVLAMALAGPANAQQTVAQQKCIKLLNVGMAKVAKTQATAFNKCSRAFAQKPMANPNPDNCVQLSSKVAKAQAKLTAKAAVMCAGAGVPTIGPTSDVTANFAGRNAAISQGYTLISDGGPLVDTLVECGDAPAKAGCKCQAMLLKGSGKLLDTYFKLFNKCKKAGLKNGGITTAADLETCLTQSALLDPKGKLPKTLAKLNRKIDVKCGGAVTNPLPNGACTGLTGANLSTCIDHVTRCSACLALENNDTLPTVDCDVFDDGAANFSCVVVD